MNRRARVGRLGACVVFLAAASPGWADDAGERFLDLVRDGKPVATVVAPADGGPVWDDAVHVITSTAGRWGGVAPRVVRREKGAPLPPGDLILLGTPEGCDAVAGLTEKAEGPVARVPFLDPQGFAVEARGGGAAKHLVVAARTPRGAFNGAVYVRDFLLDAPAGPAGKADVFARGASLVRTPRLAARGTYHLALYGVAMKYTAEDWMKVVDRYAEDGMERVYFWLSGHHPSKKYPQLYDVDATAGTRLTVEGVRRLIRHCHDRGIKFYIGGGVFAWTASHYLINGHPEVAATKAGGLCPSKPYARAGTREHFLEMCETWPEADGVMFEIRDEHGECRCADCQVSLDPFGSKGYGRAEITWLQEFARAAWTKNPKLHFCWLIGYAEHSRDVRYYEQIREMSDPRFEWLDARVGLDLAGPWRLPGPGGVPHPLAFFSPRVAHFDSFYRMPVADILRAAGRSADEGLFGYVPAFEPGFGTGSYYGDQIPFPTDVLPYCLTGFVYREATWEPALTNDELKARVRRRFFSPEAPARFVDDMVYLRQFSIDHAEVLTSYARPRYWYDGRKLDRLTPEGERRRVRSVADGAQRRQETARLRATFAKLAGVPAALDRMKEIEAALDAADPAATPKSREGAALLRRLIDDTRALYRQAVPDPRALDLPAD